MYSTVFQNALSSHLSVYYVLQVIFAFSIVDVLPVHLANLMKDLLRKKQVCESDV